MKLLTSKEAAQLMKYNLVYFRRKAKKNEIPGTVKYKGQWRFDKNTLLNKKIPEKSTIYSKNQMKTHE